MNVTEEYLRLREGQLRMSKRKLRMQCQIQVKSGKVCKKDH